MKRTNPYKSNEDIAIVKYILNNLGHHRLGGRTLWIEMESNLNMNRSWQSLKERFRSIIVKELDNKLKYNITASEAAMLRKMITVKFRTPNNHLDNRYKEKMKESKSYTLDIVKEKKSPIKEVEIENNLNDSTSSNDNCRVNDWVDSVPTWIKTYPRETRIELPTVPETPINNLDTSKTNLNNDQDSSIVKSNIYRCKKTLEEIQEHQPIFEISSDEEDNSMSHTPQNKPCNISSSSQASTIFIKQEIEEIAENHVVPGSSCNNPSSYVCESHQNLPNCVYCFIYNYIERSGNVRPDYTHAREICNNQNSNINNKRVNNEDNNVTPKKKHKNDNRCLCTGKNNAAGEREMEYNDASSLDSNVSDFRGSYVRCSTPSYQDFKFVCLVCMKTNVFSDVVLDETKRKFEKNCHHCRSLFKISYSKDRLISIYLLSEKDSRSNFSSDDKQKTKTSDDQNKKHPPTLPQSPIFIDLTQLSDNTPCKINNVPSHTLKQIHQNDNICTPVIVSKSKTKTATHRSTQHQFIKERSIDKSTDYTSIHIQKEMPLKENFCAPVIVTKTKKATTDRSTQYQFAKERSTDNFSSRAQKGIIVKENIRTSVSEEQPKIKSNTDQSTQYQFTKERSTHRSTDNLPSRVRNEMIVKENVWAPVSEEQPKIKSTTNQNTQYQFTKEKPISISSDNSSSRAQKEIIVKENIRTSVSEEQPKIKSITNQSTQYQFTKERSTLRSTDNLPSRVRNEIIVKENIWAPVFKEQLKLKSTTNQNTQYQFREERSIPISSDNSSSRAQKEIIVKENIRTSVSEEQPIIKSTTNQSTQYQFTKERSIDSSSSRAQKEIIVKENIRTLVSEEQPIIKSTANHNTQYRFTEERSIPRSTDNSTSRVQKEIIVKENIRASVSEEQPKITEVTNESTQCLQEKSILKSTATRLSHTRKQILPSKKASDPFIEIHTKLKTGINQIPQHQKKSILNPNDKKLLPNEKQIKIKTAEPKELFTTENVPILLSPISRKPLKAKDLHLETNSVRAYSEKTTSSRRRRKLFTQVEPDIEEYNENEHDQNTNKPIVDKNPDHQYDHTFSELMEEVKKIIMTETCKEISEKTKNLNSSTESEFSPKKSSPANKQKTVLKNVQIVLNKNEVEDYTRKVTFMENLSLSMSGKKTVPRKEENGGIPCSKRSHFTRFRYKVQITSGIKGVDSDD